MRELTLTDDTVTLKIKLSGEIDVVNADLFFNETEKIYQGNKKDIEFDLSGLQFLDSTALGSFVKLNNMTKRDGFKITVKNCREQIKKLFIICSLDSVINIEE